MNATKPPVNVTPVTVDAIRHINRGSLRASVDFTIAAKLQICGAKVIQQPGQQPWVAMPDIEVPAKDGSKSRWFPTVKILDEKLKEQITDAVLKAWQADSRQPQTPEGW